MKTCLFAVWILLSFAGCAQNSSQKTAVKPDSNPSTIVGGRCEGCEAIHESPVPFEKLTPVDTLPDFLDAGTKIEISGIVYQSDGKTPARDVVLYVYHTDQTGRYPTKGNEKGWDRRHGYIRGWVKTGADGNYRFFTLKPAAYPGQNENPAHIHVTVKEKDKIEYWIDDYFFEDDPILTGEMKNRQQQRGGNGIIRLVSGKDQLQGTRHIILGKNVPDYPQPVKK